MQKIAHLVVKYLNFSETFIYEQIRLMKHFTPIIFTMQKRNLKRYPVDNIHSMSDLPYFKRHAENIRSMLGFSSYFSGLIKYHDIKLIHAHFAYMGNYALQFKKYFNIPLITSFYGLDLYQLTRNPLYRIQLKRLFKEGDLFLAYSSIMKDRAIELGCPANKVRTFTAGIDINRFKYLKRPLGKDIKILFIGRFVEKKGAIYCVRAFAKSYAKHKNITLTMVGDGPLENALKRAIRKLGISDRVTMTGTIPDTSVELAKADILVSPSVVARNGDAEGGINVVVLEALACGIPAIVTEQSQSEVVIDGRSGFIARERDADDLSEKLNKLIENPDLISKFGIIGRQMAEKYDSNKQVAALESIYKELINK